MARARYKINTYYTPDANTEHVQNFDTLLGGLNIYDLDYRLSVNESPNMKNLNRNDGVLSSRDGQVWVDSDATRGVGRTCFSGLYHDNAVFHIGDKLYRMDMSTSTPEMTQLCTGVPAVRGTFFRYEDDLLYKTKGAYLRISCVDAVWSAVPVEAYVPIIQINTVPSTHSGDLYQKENRLSPAKTVWYNAASGATEYYLPVQDIDSVDKVVVDGVEKTVTTDYTVDNAAGKVTFLSAPPITDPATNNTVKITYSKANTDAYNSIMDCRYATVYGAGGNICVVFGGCPKQPNAYFWSCNDDKDMNIGYFPVSYYNLAGDSADAITGFGKQQNMLVVFKEHSVGKATFATETLSDKLVITMDYKTINSKIGCDLPWTIQLVENNLAFCNTEQGAHILLDSTAAYENNIIGFSRNVNGGVEQGKTGLLDCLRESTTDPETVCALDDEKRYCVVVGGKVYEWDYQFSSYKKPTWFFHDNVNAVAFFTDVGMVWHLDALGRVTKFSRVFADYGAGIEKVYQFPTQHFGNYDRFKNILSVVFTTRSDVDTVVDILWQCDYTDRIDSTPIQSFTWKLVPRNTAHRYLGVRRYANIARRKPGFNHVRHFAMRLSNDSPGEDMSLISAQIFYDFQGRDR